MMMEIIAGGLRVRVSHLGNESVHPGRFCGSFAVLVCVCTHADDRQRQQHYRRETNKQTNKQTNDKIRLKVLTFVIVSRGCIREVMYCCPERERVSFREL